MKKNMRVFQISGFSGFFIMGFIGLCLTAGFVGFPAYSLMKLWNFVAKSYSLTLINFWQGLLLWVIIAIIFYITNDKNRYLSSFGFNQNLSDEDVRKLIEEIKNDDKIVQDFTDKKDKENI